MSQNKIQDAKQAAKEIMEVVEAGRKAAQAVYDKHMSELGGIEKMCAQLNAAAEAGDEAATDLIIGALAMCCEDKGGAVETASLLSEFLVIKKNV